MRKTTVLLALVAVSTLTRRLPAQSILTVAGGGSDDGRPAPLAALRVPFGLCTGDRGVLYVADSYDHRVRRLDPARGLLVDVAGNGTRTNTGDGGPATLAGLAEPYACTVLADGTLVVADTHNNLVRAVDPGTRRIRTVAGKNGMESPLPGFGGDGGPATLSVLDFPSGVAAAPNGDLFVADTRNHCVRRIAKASGVIETVAGTGRAPGSSGDGGPATRALLREPWGLAFDREGRLLVADSGNHAVRRIDLASGRIERVAGTGEAGSSGDGGPAAAARLDGPRGLAVDANGTLFVAEAGGNRVRAVTSGTITTCGGTGEGGFSGDGGPATAGRFSAPSGVAVVGDAVFVADSENNRVRRIGVDGFVATAAGIGTRGLIGDGGPAVAAGLAFPYAVLAQPDGSLLLVDSYNRRLRRVDAATSVIATLAGVGTQGSSGDGGPATLAELDDPRAAVLASNGDVYLADTGNHRVVVVRRATGLLATVAGVTGSDGYAGDGGPATRALLRRPWGLALDASGGLLVSDSGNHAVRRVELASGRIAAVAGDGTAGDGGDGGPATRARLAEPAGLLLGTSGELLVADSANHVVRRIGPDGTISTVAGNRVRAFAGDGGPATAASIGFPSGLAFGPDGSLFVADTDNARVRRVDASTGVVATVVGGVFGFSGDGGPATRAGLTQPQGVWVSPVGDLFVADTENSRVRVVRACTPVAEPALEAPADAAEVAVSTVLSWRGAPGAFRYDVFLDPADPPQKVAAEDVTGTSLAVSALAPGTRYAWRVVAKGDPFCVPAQRASSAVRRFTTARGCAAPAAFDVVTPARGAEVAGSEVVLGWQGAADAASYDVYLGTSVPPPLLAAGVAGTSLVVPSLVPGSTVTWHVVARAACDLAATRPTPEAAFRVIGTCAPPGGLVAQAPADGASGLGSRVTFVWAASSGATSYDLLLGTGSELAPVRTGLSGTSAVVDALAPGALYRWRVVARSCPTGPLAESAVASFAVAAACEPLPAPAFLSVPASGVGSGQTYALSWTVPEGAPPGTTYRIERSASAGFEPLLDVQETPQPWTSFLAGVEGTFFHRVSARAPCAGERPAAASSPAAVVVTGAAPNVVVTTPPEAVFVAPGERLEDKRTWLTLENLTDSPLPVVLSRQELGSVPFFHLVDPLGGDGTSLTLAPHAPRTLEVRFSGPPADRSGTYQGVVVVTSPGTPLAVAPYAWVSLSVGGGAGGAAPELLADGRPAEVVSFPGFLGDDADRPPLAIEVRNPGDAAMELAAEVGPEVWLEPVQGWNATPLPPGATRTLLLRTRRSRSPSGSTLPRATYLTVRTGSGATSRLLVQDVGVSETGSGRERALAPSAASHLVPSVAHARSRLGNTFVSEVRLSNAGTEPVRTDLTFTPAGADGFDATRVRRATVVVPPGDVVALTDPVVRLFGGEPPLAGALEVATDPARAGLVTVVSTVTAAAPGGGSFGFQMPTVRRGDGARLGERHSVPGVVEDAVFRSNLILAETTGVDAARVKVTLVDRGGRTVGETVTDVPRYGQRQISSVARELGATGEVRAARLEVETVSGGGTVAAVVTTVDNVTDDAVTWSGRAVGTAAGPRRAGPAGRRPGWTTEAGATHALVVPSLVNGFATFPGTDRPATFRSLLGLSSGTLAPAVFRLTYRDLERGTSVEKTVTVPPRATSEFENACEQLFEVPPGARSQGPLFVEADENGVVYSRVTSLLEDGTLGDSFPVVGVRSASLTGGASAQPVLLDGLEQSTTRTRGTRSNLLLNELLGKGVRVNVRLYEAANRTRPIAEKDVDVGPLAKVQLSTVFAALGLDEPERRKDRTNVLCVVTARSGEGLVSAVVTTIDNRTGDTRNLPLAPSGGTPAGPGIGR